jgi:hypothetical protein
VRKRQERKQQETYGEYRRGELLCSIDQNLFALLHKLFPVPTDLSISLEGDVMTQKNYDLGATATGSAVEVDNLVTPPAPFAYAKGSVVFAQSGGAGTFTDNGDGTFKYVNTNVAEVVTVTATDSVSNPGTTLTNTAVLTFQAPAELPNQLDIVLA